MYQFEQTCMDISHFYTKLIRDLRDSFNVFKFDRYLNMYMGGYRKIVLLLGIVFLIPMFQNCAPMKGIGSVENSSFSAGNYKAVQSILDNQCLVCHSVANASNGNIALDSYQSILDSNVVVGGNAEASSLFTSVESGSMPQGMPPLSDADVQIMSFGSIKSLHLEFSISINLSCGNS